MRVNLPAFLASFSVRAGLRGVVVWNVAIWMAVCFTASPVSQGIAGVERRRRQPVEAAVEGVMPGHLLAVESVN